MALHWSPYLIALIVSTIIPLLLALFLWIYLKTTSIKIGSMILVACALWSLGHLLEAASVEYTTKIFWSKMEYIGIVLVPTFWVIYVLHYIGKVQSPAFLIGIEYTFSIILTTEYLVSNMLNLPIFPDIKCH